MAPRISSCDGRKISFFGVKSTEIRASTAVAPSLVAKIGFRSISWISGKSAIMFETATTTLASASRSTGSAPRTPRSTSAAWMPSSIESASSVLAGARRKVTSFSTSTRTPPSPKATSLPKLGSVTAPTITSCAWPVSICWTWTPSTLALGAWPLAASTIFW